VLILDWETLQSSSRATEAVGFDGIAEDRMNENHIERRSGRSGNSYEWLSSFSRETTSSAPVGASIRTA